jgi:hypothetical protein
LSQLLCRANFGWWASILGHTGVRYFLALQVCLIAILDVLGGPLRHFFKAFAVLAGLQITALLVLQLQPNFFL